MFGMRCLKGGNGTGHPGKRALLLLALAVGIEPTHSQEEPAGRANPLAGLPSAPGPHVEKLKALGDNQWLDLGSPAPDTTQAPGEQIPRGRSWGGRALCSAADLRGAFFCGTGVHGYRKSDGRYMDDLWFYDIHANKWICCYPGADSKTLKLELDEHGFEVNEAGEHIPVSYLSHAYGNMTYDAHRKKLVIIWSQCPWWNKILPQRAEWLGIPEGQRKNAYALGKFNPAGKHPLFWDAVTGKWERRFVPGEGPETPGAAWARLTEYLPSTQGIYHADWMYDPDANAWVKLEVTGKGDGHNGCLDSKRERLYAVSKDRMARLDLKTRQWTDVKAEGQPENFGSSNDGRLTFDTASGKLVWHRNVLPFGQIRVYDPESNTWETPENTFPKLDEKRLKHKRIHGCYDESLNVHFYYLAGDSENANASMLAYRYKNRKE